MMEKVPPNGSSDPTSNENRDAVREFADPRETLNRWRMGSVQELDAVGEVVTRPSGRWPDEESRKAEELLAQKGVDIPWSHNDRFGKRSFRVTGLRAGGAGVVLFVELSIHGMKRQYAAKTLNSFLKPDYLRLAPPVQEKIARAFLEETLPWLEMGQHPHIVSVRLLENIVHPVLHRNVPFVFSDYIPGGNLKRVLDSKGKLSVRESLALGIHLCEGLLHAYDHGITSHQDIKPENIMVYDDGLFQITDFGANVIGTPGYMAPEQIAALWRRRGKPIIPGPVLLDHRVDQFAVGLVMLESCCSGFNFSLGREAVRKREMALRYIAEGGGQIVDGSLNEPFRGILERTLSSDPAERYPDISSLREDLIEYYEKEYGVYEMPEVAKDDSAEWWFHRGEAFSTLGRPILAEEPFKKALERYDRLPGAQLEEARCAMQLGMAYRETGRLPEAKKITERALELFCSIPGAELDQATCTRNLGIIHSYSGHFSEAERAFREALDILRPIPGTELHIATCTLDFGTVYNSTGRFPEAEKVYREALGLFRRLPGTEREQARCVQNLGITLSMMGRFPESEKEYIEALSIYRRIPGIEFEMGICTMNLGGVYYFVGRYREAEKLLNEALRIHRSIPGTEHERARCIQNLGSILYASGRLPEAEKMFEEALGMYRNIPGAEIDQADCIENRGNILRDTGRYSEAEEAYLEALKIYRDYPGVELMQGRCTSELARCCQVANDSSRARDLAEEALRLLKPFPAESTEKIRDHCYEILGISDEKE